MNILETPRLVLRELGVDDAPFILRLVNEPAWLRFIGDRGVRTLEDACAYILKGPVEMYARHGFGLWLVERREGGLPIGLCGLLKRDTLEDIDLGFALLAEHRGKGYAFEAASGVMAHARSALHCTRLLAITSPENEVSGRLLEKLGFGFERMARPSAGTPATRVYAVIL